MQGNAGTWRIGDREMFFLRREHGYLRTICDFRQFCVLPVLSGSHVGWKADSSAQTLPYRVVDLLLSRGTDCDDKQFANAIERSANSFPLEYVLPSLRVLSRDRSPEVREAAKRQWRLLTQGLCPEGTRE